MSILYHTLYGLSRYFQNFFEKFLLYRFSALKCAPGQNGVKCFTLHRGHSIKNAHHLRPFAIVDDCIDHIARETAFDIINISVLVLEQKFASIAVNDFATRARIIGKHTVNGVVDCVLVFAFGSSEVVGDVVHTVYLSFFLTLILYHKTVLLSIEKSNLIVNNL